MLLPEAFLCISWAISLDGWAAQWVKDIVGWLTSGAVFLGSCAASWPVGNKCSLLGSVLNLSHWTTFTVTWNRQHSACRFTGGSRPGDMSRVEEWYACRNLTKQQEQMPSPAHRKKEPPGRDADWEQRGWGKTLWPALWERPWGCWQVARCPERLCYLHPWSLARLNQTKSPKIPIPSDLMAAPA